MNTWEDYKVAPVLTWAGEPDFTASVHTCEGEGEGEGEGGPLPGPLPPTPDQAM